MITNLRRYGAPARVADGGPSMGHHPRGTTSPRQVAPKRTGVNAHQDEDVRAAILSSVVVSECDNRQIAEVDEERMTPSCAMTSR